MAETNQIETARDNIDALIIKRNENKENLEKSEQDLNNFIGATRFELLPGFFVRVREDGQFYLCSAQMVGDVEFKTTDLQTLCNKLQELGFEPVPASEPIL